MHYRMTMSIVQLHITPCIIQPQNMFIHKWHFIKVLKFVLCNNGLSGLCGHLWVKGRRESDATIVTVSEELPFRAADKQLYKDTTTNTSAKCESSLDIISASFFTTVRRKLVYHMKTEKYYSISYFKFSGKSHYLTLGTLKIN